MQYIVAFISSPDLESKQVYPFVLIHECFDGRKNDVICGRREENMAG